MKAPKDIPTRQGQRVVLRGREHRGTVAKLNGNWAWIDWDQKDCGAATINHTYELVVLVSEDTL